MREIKFRAWDTKNNLMSPVGGIDFKDGDKPRALIYQPVMTNDGVDWDADTVDHIELMQYTGLKDKNGKEIYEGDVLGGYPNKSIMYEVKFGRVEIDDNEGYSSNIVVGFYLEREFIDDRKPFHFDYENENSEVIGNIYENPELLESK